jgi:hypothetical protein
VGYAGEERKGDAKINDAADDDETNRNNYMIN